MLSAREFRQLRTVVPGLSQASADLQERIRTTSRWKQSRANVTLYRTDTESDTCQLILAGQIRVILISEEGREIVLFRTPADEACLIATSCLLGQADYPVHLETETACVSVEVPEAALLQLVSASEEFRDFVLSSLASRLGNLITALHDLAFTKLDRRLATALLNSGGTINATHQWLAAEVGSVREVVSRVLKSFEDQGLVTLSRNRITIDDRPGLESLADSGRIEDSALM